VDTLAWGIVGSVAGVAGTVATIAFGVIPLVRSRSKAGIPPSVQGPPVELPSGQSAQAGASNGQVAQHIENYLERMHPPMIPMQGSVVVGEVPQRAPAYQPRRELMIRLGEGGPGVTVVRAVTGMRGVGKTQLAAAYAQSRINECWRLVAWVNAENPPKILNGLAKIAAAVGLENPGADLESLGEAVRHWLEADGERCLVVFDNATNMDFLARFVPSGGQCQVIITSNQLETLAFGEAMAVGVFTRQEALSFLAQRTGRPVDARARELADELGFLPLALAQAAAVIAAQHLDYPTYLARLRSLPVQALMKRTTGEPYAHGVAEAIVLALTMVADEDRTGLCGALMNVIALLSTAGVSRALLYSAGQEGMLQFPGSDTATEPESIDEALGQLASASLLTFSMDHSTVAAHRLTMRVARERQAQDGSLAELGAGIAQLLVAVTQSLIEPWQNRSAARDTIQQIMALHEHLAPHLGEREAALTETLLRLRAWALWCLIKLGDSSAQAIEHGQHLITDAERILGASHSATLKSRNDLGEAYRESRRLDEAIRLFECTLADCERILGESHPDTLESRNDLALAYRDAHRLGEAIPLFEHTLTDRERALGESHPDTLTVRNNLASAYQDAGRLEEAIPLFERTLADCERVLGESHPNTLKTRNNLAETYRDGHRLDKAIPLFERTLADRERVLGVAHPDTLKTRNNLIRAYQDAGQLAQSESLRNRRR
jgi:tetratricopeptide (TPR) repeat protein